MPIPQLVPWISRTGTSAEGWQCESIRVHRSRRMLHVHFASDARCRPIWRPECDVVGNKIRATACRAGERAANDIRLRVGLSDQSRAVGELPRPAWGKSPWRVETRALDASPAPQVACRTRTRWATAWARARAWAWCGRRAFWNAGGGLAGWWAANAPAEVQPGGHGEMRAPHAASVLATMTRQTAPMTCHGAAEGLELPAIVI